MVALAMLALVMSVPPAEARGSGRASFARFSGAALGSYLRKSRRAEIRERRNAAGTEVPEALDIEGTPRVSTYSRSVLEAPAGPAGATGGCAEMQALAAPIRSLPTREEWSAECGKVGRLAGSGMGFCVVDGE